MNFGVIPTLDMRVPGTLAAITRVVPMYGTVILVHLIAMDLTLKVVIDLDRHTVTSLVERMNPVKTAVGIGLGAISPAISGLISVDLVISIASGRVG